MTGHSRYAGSTMSAPPPEDAVYFHEVQRPRWTIGLTLLVAVWAVTLLALYVFQGRTPRPSAYVHGALLLLVIMAVLSRLRTVVEGHTLELERRWGARLTVDLRRVRTVRATSYYPRIDGGWGVRNGQGVILTREDGDVLYVGSARAKELCEVLRSLLPAASAGYRRALTAEAKSGRLVSPAT